MPLTDPDLRHVKATEKGRKLFDERGLYLIVSGKGAGWWRFKYRMAGVEKGMSLGIYPDVSLKRAREKRDEARALVADGIDPSAKRQAEKVARADSFEGIAREWLDLNRKALAPETVGRYEDFLVNGVFPYLGKRPIASILAADLLPVLKRIEAKGRHETAHRTRSVCGRVFRYAVATGRAERDPTADLKGALAPAVKKNFASITDPGRVGALLRAIDTYIGQPTTHAALRLAPLLFVRPGELRAAEWSEFDLEGAEWRIPSSKMKMDREHIVPLPRQALSILNELHPLTGDGKYLFQSLRTPARPISENTINAALRRIGYGSDEQTGHGFRSMASTLLNEQGWHPDLIELQLSHVERNKVRGAYNKAQRLAERRKMMQAWADYLDGLKAGGKVVAIRERQAMTKALPPEFGQMLARVRACDAEDEELAELLGKLVELAGELPELEVVAMKVVHERIRELQARFRTARAARAGKQRAAGKRAQVRSDLERAAAALARLRAANDIKKHSLADIAAESELPISRLRKLTLRRIRAVAWRAQKNQSEMS